MVPLMLIALFLVVGILVLLSGPLSRQAPTQRRVFTRPAQSLRYIPEADNL
jgi:hypothetical protein